MGVTLNMHRAHRVHTNGLEAVKVKGGTVGECLKALVDLHPEMQKALFDDKGKLKNQIEIYLNMESAYPDELKKPVNDGDEIHITIMLSGG